MPFSFMERAFLLKPDVSHVSQTLTESNNNISNVIRRCFTFNCFNDKMTANNRSQVLAPQKPQTRCCSTEDVYVVACIVVGLVCLLCSVLEIFLTPDPTLWRVIHVAASISLAGCLALSQAVPCCRQVSFVVALSTGFSIGLIGNSLGFVLVGIWNISSSIYVQEQYANSGVSKFYTEPVNVELDAILFLGITGLLTTTLWFIHGFILKSSPSSKMSCRQKIFNFILWISVSLSIIVCTALGFFVLAPDTSSHGYFFGKLVEAPPTVRKPQMLLAGLMFGGAFISTTLLMRQSVGSFFRTLFLLAILLGHMAMVMIGSIDFDFPGEWSAFPQQIVWMIFSVSSLSLFLTLAVYSAISGSLVVSSSLSDYTEADTYDYSNKSSNNNNTNNNNNSNRLRRSFGSSSSLGFNEYRSPNNNNNNNNRHQSSPSSIKEYPFDTYRTTASVGSVFTPYASTPNIGGSTSSSSGSNSIAGQMTLATLPAAPPLPYPPPSIAVATVGGVFDEGVIVGHLTTNGDGISTTGGYVCGPPKESILVDSSTGNCFIKQTPNTQNLPQGYIYQSPTPRITMDEMISRFSAKRNPTFIQ